MGSCFITNRIMYIHGNKLLFSIFRSRYNPFACSGISPEGEHPSSLFISSGGCSLFLRLWVLCYFFSDHQFRFCTVSEDKSTLALVFFSISGLALSWLGGMDYTRLIFIGFPWIITMILVLSKPNRLEFFAAIGISLIITRFWMVVPMIGKDLSPYNAWMPEYASAPWLLGWAFLAILCLGLIAAIHIIQKRQSKSIPSGK
jgi:hypothetical protein